MNTNLEKSEKRKIILFKRRELSHEEWERRSALIFNVILAQGWYDKAVNLLVYVDQDNEVDTHGIILHALTHGKRVYCPVAEPKSYHMEFYRIRSTGDLKPGFNGIMEPEALEENLFHPDGFEDNTLIIVPGTVFDREGNRIGYGNGYYDAYLERIKGGPFHTLSPIFEFQLVDKVPYDPYDKKVECIITENGMIGKTDHPGRVSFGESWGKRASGEDSTEDNLEDNIEDSAEESIVDSAEENIVDNAEDNMEEYKDMTMTKSEIIRKRIDALRDTMERLRVNTYIIPTGDPHISEYISSHYKIREYMSGFTGSAGTMLISRDKALLWTDGRYFLQAQEEIKGTGIDLMRSGEKDVPTLYEYLKDEAGRGDVIAFDPYITPRKMSDKIKETLKNRRITIYDGPEVFKEAGLWEDRPAIDVRRAEMLPPEYCGKSAANKLKDLRIYMLDNGLDACFISALDEIMWLFNIRGGDIPHEPVAYSHALIDGENAYLFIHKEALHQEINDYLKEQDIEVREYDQALDTLKVYLDKKPGCRMMYDPGKVCHAFGEALASAQMSRDVPSVIDGFKAVKEEKELSYIRNVYLRDSLVLTRFIMELKQNIGMLRMRSQEGGLRIRYGSIAPGPFDEYRAGLLLDDMRLREKGCLDLSFDTIMAYGKNGAIVHYRAPEAGSAMIEDRGFLLIDSGGQYLGGTTDVTRTVVLGEVSGDEKKYFTAVAAGMLRLADARFPRGCTGRNLDILARGPLWDIYADFRHGTGHGVGYMLNVHEGPQSISTRKREGDQEAELKPGMLISDEPGCYRDGVFGIRTENILEVKAGPRNADGEFLYFSHLTYVPVDLDGIDPEFMGESDRKLLNDYHRMVFEKLSPMMSESEIKWLQYATRPV